MKPMKMAARAFAAVLLASSLAAADARAAEYYELTPQGPEQGPYQWVHSALPGMRLVKVFAGPYNPRKRQENCTLLARGEPGTPVRPEDVISMSCYYLRP